MMPKWLQGMVAPTLLLWFYAIASGVASGMTRAGDLPKGANIASRAAFSLILALWVITDAQKRRRSVCYDYDSFVFFAWPVVVPIYLFRTRGLRAFLTVFCFAGICVAGWITAALVILIREFVL